MALRRVAVGPLPSGPVPAVFVHGVPETAHVWEPLRSHLGRSDSLALALPGFGTDRPEGFTATKDAYVDWLIAELESIGEPVDLVGHDWGGILVPRVVSLRPDLVASWVTDCIGVLAPDYAWHTFARIWQTPGDGEMFWEQQLGALDEWADGFVAMGVPEADAQQIVAAVDHTMAQCILDLYRSALAVNEEWGPDTEGIEVPGLALVATADPFVDVEHQRTAAERAGARVLPLEGESHWWMLTISGEAAATLESFWTFG